MHLNCGVENTPQQRGSLGKGSDCRGAIQVSDTRVWLSVGNRLGYPSTEVNVPD